MSELDALRWAMIDNYDSFTYNLVQRFGELGVGGMKVWRNDALSVEELLAWAPDALIVSPGPNGPDEAGVSLDALGALMGRVPVLGVCLGHQAIAQSLGARIVLAERPVHGKTSTIEHDGRGLFEGLPQGFEATRYHSRLVDPDSLPEVLEASAVTSKGELMGLRHRHWPVFGVQFHPESILTSEGLALMDNFVEVVRRHAHRRAAGGAWRAGAVRDKPEWVEPG